MAKAPNLPAGRRIGAARCQFIAEVRRVVATLDNGRAASAAIADVRQALDTYDKVRAKEILHALDARGEATATES